MTKATTKQPLPTDPTVVAGPKEIAFSVRFTAEEHELLKQAATLRGWRPTDLIRSASIERAKHILNTSRVTTFNFKGLAVRIADQLFKPRTYELRLGFDEDHTGKTTLTTEELGDFAAVDPHASPLGITSHTEEFSPDVIDELKNAAKWGGGEFLNQIVEYCEGLTASRRRDVPKPLDPSA